MHIPLASSGQAYGAKSAPQDDKVKEKMTTTAAAENKAGHPAEKEKMEKRRALGRGLESLLPRPRVVAPASQVTPQYSGDSSTAEARSAGQPGEAVPTSGEISPAVIPVIRAVVEEASPSTSVESDGGIAAELRWAGQPRAAAPTWPGETSAQQESITILAQTESRIPGNLVVNLEIGDIDKNPFQTRYVQDGAALDELAESIKVNGVVQPIVVRPAAEDGRYVLVLGERRLHASRKAGKTTIPAMVRRISEQQAAEMTIVENLQREDLSPLEQAEAFRVLSEEFNLTQAEIGQRVGLSRESISNYMRLLKLPRQVMQLLAEKKIKFAEAKELLKLDDNDKITKAALYAVKHGYTIEQIEKLVMQMEGWLESFPGMPGEERKKSGARWVDPNVRAAQMDLERLLGVRVKIRDRKGKGKIVIEYSTVDDYERVVGMLRGAK
jgi:ParB family transcriptional regulator, chromosome partitioning protein